MVVPKAAVMETISSKAAVMETISSKATVMETIPPKAAVMETIPPKAAVMKTATTPTTTPAAGMEAATASPESHGRAAGAHSRYHQQ
jgi:hypothetical protein